MEQRLGAPAHDPDPPACEILSRFDAAADARGAHGALTYRDLRGVPGVPPSINAVLHRMETGLVGTWGRPLGRPAEQRRDSLRSGPRSGGKPLLNVDRSAFDLREGGEIQRGDTDLVRNGVIDSVRATGPVHAGLKGDTLFVRPVDEEANGAYTLTLYASNACGVASRTVRGTVEKVTDLRAGQLQNSETDAGAAGVVRLYAVDRTFLAEVRTDSLGYFDGVQLPRNEDCYLVQARLIRDGMPESFVRTDTLCPEQRGGDIAIDPLRVVPYAGLSNYGTTPMDFRRYVLQMYVVDKTVHPAARARLLRRWDLEKVQGVYVSKTLCKNDTPISRRRMRLLRRKITDPAAIPSLLGGDILDVTFGDVTDPERPFDHECLPKGNRKISVDRGWIVIAPGCGEKSCTGAARYVDEDDDGIVESGGVVIWAGVEKAGRDDSFGAVVVHEMIHTLLATAHTSFCAPFTTMNRYGCHTEDGNPGFFDVKLSEIIYEETYAPLTHLPRLVGLDFYPIQPAHSDRARRADFPATGS